MRSVNLETALLSDGLSVRAVAFLTQMRVVRVRANPSESLAAHQASLIPQQLLLPLLSALCGRSVALQPQGADSHGCSRVLGGCG